MNKEKALRWMREVSKDPCSDSMFNNVIEFLENNEQITTGEILKKQERKMSKNIWSDEEAIILRKPKKCKKCGRRDMSRGDWIYLILKKLQKNEAVVIKSNKNHLGLQEDIQRMLKCVGVVVNEEPKWETVELPYYGHWNKESEKVVSKMIKLEKIPFLNDKNLME